MARYNANRVKYNKQDHLMLVLCRVLRGFKTAEEMRNFLKDLLNRDERIMIIRRLLIAERLLQGKTYRAIKQELGAGSSTVARVDRWLHFGRGGYKQAVAKLRGLTSASR